MILHNRNVFKFKLFIYFMNKLVEIVLGLILVIIAVLGWILLPGGWGEAALTFLKGGIVWFVILIGILFLVLGISDLKE